jgi:hypothetical protein
MDFYDVIRGLVNAVHYALRDDERQKLLDAIDRHQAEHGKPPAPAVVATPIVPPVPVPPAGGNV